MKREPTAEEREKIVRAIAAGDRIGATSMYISITECGLTEAQEFIRARITELQAENPEKFTQKQPKRRRFAARPSPAREMRPAIGEDSL
jgi:RNA processing factor Prp31